MMKEKDEAGSAGQTSRRRFTKAVAAALVTAPIASAVKADAQTPPAPREPKAPPNPLPNPAPQQPQPQKPSPVAEAYAEVARLRFGQQTTPQEFDRLKRDLEGHVRAADRLRAFKLQNGDEPDFIFSA